jgi:hypothetical protein
MRLRYKKPQGLCAHRRRLLLLGFQVVVSFLLLWPPPEAGAASLTVYHAAQREPNDSLHVFLQNKSPNPIAITGYQLKEIASPIISWHRLRPDQIPPGGIADLTVKLKDRISPLPLNVTVEIGGKEKMTLTATPKVESMRITTVAFAPDLRTVYIYAKAAGTGPITSVFLDGVVCSREAGASLPAPFDRGLAMVKLTLPTPLTQGAFKVVGLKAGEHFTACQVRVWPAKFLLGTYGSHLFDDYKNHGLNHYISFQFVTPPRLAQLAALGMTAGTVCFPYLEAKGQKDYVRFMPDKSAQQIAQSKDSAALEYYYLTDEPDCADSKFGGLGSTAMEMIARAAFCEQKDPQHPTFIQIDNTTKPRNYLMYGEIPDLVASHRYVLGHGDFLEDMTTAIRRLKHASEPRPLLWVTQFKNLRSDRTGRPPAYGEMRLQCYLSAAEGAKGILHYIHSDSEAGGEGGRDKKLWDVMTQLHQELAILGPVLAIGEVANLATVNPQSLRAATIRSPDKIVLILLNPTCKTSYSAFEQLPSGPVKVSVSKPTGFTISKVFAVEGGEKAPVPFKDANDVITLEIKSLQDAKAFILE